MEWVADVVDRANSLLDDRDAAIGPSYFMNKKNLNEDDVARIWKYSVRPYIEERLFGHGTDRMADFELDTLRRDIARNTGGDGGGSDSGEDVITLENDNDDMNDA